MKTQHLFRNLAATVLLAAASTSAIAATSTEISFANASAFGTSSSTIMVQNIELNYVVTNPFDPTHPAISTTSYNVPFQFDATTMHLVPTLGGAVDATSTSNLCANVTVYISDAATGSVLPNATATIGSTTVTADSSGMATFTGLVSGTSSLTASASNYTSSSRQVTLSCTTANSVGIALTPTTGTGAIAASDIRITLSWGADPRDLDSHLTAPSSTSTGAIDDTTNRVHTYFAARTQDVAVLDTDDTSGYGPETITISPPTGSTTLRQGLYRYSVYHYSGLSTIDASGASVILNIGGRQQEFLPPAGSLTGSGDLWTVFELYVDSSGAVTVYPVSTYSTATSSTVRATSTGYGDVERGVDFARMPAKP